MHSHKKSGSKKRSRTAKMVSKKSGNGSTSLSEGNAFLLPAPHATGRQVKKIAYISLNKSH